MTLPWSQRSTQAPASSATVISATVSAAATYPVSGPTSPTANQTSAIWCNWSPTADSDNAPHRRAMGPWAKGFNRRIEGRRE
ncbi:hypothetical protein AZA_24247 [Nitrospirillum viridazoti Y2]|nr:hypothetical protein AZA_24247 [Nitrospirillum amazonense Y2]